MAGGPGGDGQGIESGSKLIAILMASFAAFGGILFGYVGFHSFPKSFVKLTGHWYYWWYQADYDAATNTYALSTPNESLVVSILSAGTFFGALLAYPMGDILGRRLGLIASCAVFCVGVGMQLSTSFGVFVGGRVIAGLGVGLVSCLVPMYQSECSPKSVRGFVVGCYQWAITIGLLIASVVNEATKDIDSNWSWKIVIVIQFAWAAILVGGLLFLPESPRYLVLKGRMDAAHKAAGRLSRTPPNGELVVREIKNIAAALEAERALGQTSFLDCFSNGTGKNRLRVLTGIFLQAWQQLTGINFIFYYGTTFFAAYGFSAPFTLAIITNVVNVVCTIPGLFLIDRAGRRTLLLYGAVIMCICEYMVAILGVTVGGTHDDGNGGRVYNNKSAFSAIFAFICIYICMFAATWGPIAWVVTGEIFPSAIRAKAMAMSTASNWLWNFGIGYATPYLVNPSTPTLKAANLGIKVFFIWGSTCAGCAVFTWFCIPETKGLTLEQVDLLYKNSSIRNSNTYRQQMINEGDSYLERIATSERQHGIKGDDEKQEYAPQTQGLRYNR